MKASLTGSSRSHCHSSICTCAFPYQILNTCQQLRHEATPLLLAATTLNIFDTAQMAATRLPKSYVSAIQRAAIINPETFAKAPLKVDALRLSSLKTLELRNITVWCKYHDATYLESEQADECMIGLALFNLNRISPQLTKLCNDTERSFKVILCCQYVASSLRDETVVSSA
jgi:hypothetical protein